MNNDDQLIIRWPDGTKEVVSKTPRKKSLLKTIAHITLPLLILSGGGLLTHSIHRFLKPTSAYTTTFQENKNNKIAYSQKKKDTTLLKENGTTPLQALYKHHGIDKELERQMKRLTQQPKNKATIEDILTQATKYDDYFEKASQLTGLDKNLIKAYITTESGHKNFSPYSMSKSGAVGPAQMMEKAARESGLKIIKNKKGQIVYDQRRDPEAIISSAEYLKKYMNGDIILGLACYNAGPGTVEKLIKKKQSDVFAKLFKSGETREYVLKALSRMEVLKNPGAYGLNIGKKPLHSDMRKNARLHTLKKGETIHNLTRTYPNTTFDAIKKSNPAIVNYDHLPHGIKVYVPICQR